MKSSARGGPGKCSTGLRAAVAPIKQPSARKVAALRFPSILRTTDTPPLKSHCSTVCDVSSDTYSRIVPAKYDGLQPGQRTDAAQTWTTGSLVDNGESFACAHGGRWHRVLPQCAPILMFSGVQSPDALER